MAMEADEAKAAGFAAIAGPYAKSEEWMMTHVLRDLRGVETCTVETSKGLEIWRKGAIQIQPED
jgi:hypothetical protein